MQTTKGPYLIHLDKTCKALLFSVPVYFAIPQISTSVSDNKHTLSALESESLIISFLAATRWPELKSFYTLMRHKAEKTRPTAGSNQNIAVNF